MVSTLVPTIFHEEWWLDAATDGAYEVAEVVNGGAVVGRLPYCRGRKHGLAWSALPTLTHFLGPAVDEGNGSINTRFIRRLEVTRELIQKLPAASYMQIKCHRGVRDVIPFQEQKFRTGVQFTHEIQPAPSETLWKNLRHERRRVIVRAQETLDIAPYEDIENFARFYDANLVSKNVRSTINMVQCRKVIEACLTKQRGQILVARDKNGALQAATFCAWDATAMYYLMTTRAETSGNGAVSALIWASMQDAANRQLIFDLDGLASHGSIMFYAGFGGTVEPRYIATKMSLPIQLAYTVLKGSAEHQWFT